MSDGRRAAPELPRPGGSSSQRLYSPDAGSSTFASMRSESPRPGSADRGPAPPPVPVVESACATRPLQNTAAIEWTIFNFSSLDHHHVVGPQIKGRTKSELMDAAGHTWRLNLCPGGYSDISDPEEVKRDRAEHVAIYLFYKGTRAALRCQFSIALVNQHDDKDDDEVQAPPVTFGQRSQEQVYQVDGFPKFMRRAVLEDEANGYKMNDTVVRTSCRNPWASGARRHRRFAVAIAATTSSLPMLAHEAEHRHKLR